MLTGLPLGNQIRKNIKKIANSEFQQFDEGHLVSSRYLVSSRFG